jgi:hypothetical protein
VCWHSRRFRESPGTESCSSVQPPPSRNRARSTLDPVARVSYRPSSPNYRTRSSHSVPPEFYLFVPACALVSIVVRHHTRHRRLHPPRGYNTPRIAGRRVNSGRNWRRAGEDILIPPPTSNVETLALPSGLQLSRTTRLAGVRPVVDSTLVIVALRAS